MLKLSLTCTRAAILAAFCGTATLAAEPMVVVEEAYARSSHPGAKVGAAFMVIRNQTDADDTLIAGSYDGAARVELHTHRMVGDVMQMVEIEGGIAVPAGSEALLQRGGDHVMLMGLTEEWQDGMEIEVTLTFENAGDVTVTMPIDRTRKPRKTHHNH